MSSDEDSDNASDESGEVHIDEILNEPEAESMMVSSGPEKTQTESMR